MISVIKLILPMKFQREGMVDPKLLFSQIFGQYLSYVYKKNNQLRKYRLWVKQSTYKKGKNDQLTGTIFSKMNPVYVKFMNNRKDYV